MKLSLMLALLSLISRMFGQSIYCDEINQQISSMGTFPFGVSSGDPRTHSFIALTQLNPCKIMNGNIVQCEVSKDPNFLQLVAQEYQIPLADNGYSVKFAIGSLAEAEIYYYRFIYGNDTSRVGRAKTCCEDCNTISFAVVSCSNYEWGYFNAYGRIARMENIDFVVHLGDYIYEHGPGVYGNKELPRKHLPRKEIVLLEDYRSRYAQYRLDPNLQDLHAAYSFITVWDDHEIANDAYKDGAQNHQAEEGEWDERKNTARKVYFEWLPVTENTNQSIQRKFVFGKLASLYLLDERLEARTEQGKGDDNANRTMLGDTQRTWFSNEVLRDSSTVWKIWGNQVIFNPVQSPSAVVKALKYKTNNDMWDGYSEERKQILQHWAQNQINNVVILTGDAHFSMGIETRFEGKTLGVEWVTPSITSANLNERISTFKSHLVERMVRKKSLNPHVKHVDLCNHGCMVVEINEHEAKNTWYYERSILKEGSNLRKKKKASIKAVKK